jgi:hypothetical protein
LLCMHRWMPKSRSASASPLSEGGVTQPVYSAMVVIIQLVRSEGVKHGATK